MRALGRLAIIMTILLLGVTFAYDRDHPPYSFKGGAPEHIKAELLVDYKRTEYSSLDGQAYVKLNDGIDGVDLIIRDGRTSLKTMYFPFARAVYWADLDNNGLKDFIVFYISRGNGLGLEGDAVEIFLKAGVGDYRKISYNTTYAGIEDFVDMNMDGVSEVIVTGFYYGGRHNYFTYSIFEFTDFRLTNADNKYPGFPKFVKFTYAYNDKNVHHLLRGVRSMSPSGKAHQVWSPAL